MVLRVIPKVAHRAVKISRLGKNRISANNRDSEFFFMKIKSVFPGNP